MTQSLLGLYDALVSPIGPGPVLARPILDAVAAAAAGRLTKDEAAVAIAEILPANPYPRTFDPEAVRARLADPDFQQWRAWHETNGPGTDAPSAFLQARVIACGTLDDLAAVWIVPGRPRGFTARDEQEVAG